MKEVFPMSRDIEIYRVSGLLTLVFRDHDRGEDPRGSAWFRAERI